MTPHRLQHILHPLLLTLAILAFTVQSAMSQRRVTPVNTPATATQPVNEFKNDTARINAAKRASLVHYHDEHGNVVLVDTVTGEEWVDTATVESKIPKMQYPLLESVTVGVDIADPLMRLFGRNYGLFEFWGMLSIHNRYMPVVEIGLGQARNTPDDSNFTYKSPVAPYFRIGANYNFLYNSPTDYQFWAGLRFGMSSFRYEVTDVHLNDPYWQEYPVFSVPSQSSTAFFWEIMIGLKVKLFRNVSAGWQIKWHSLLAETGGTYGKPWYIPGYGTRGSSLAVGFSLMYTIPLGKRESAAIPPGADPGSGIDGPVGTLPGRAPGIGPDAFPDSGDDVQGLKLQ